MGNAGSKATPDRDEEDLDHPPKAHSPPQHTPSSKKEPTPSEKIASSPKEDAPLASPKVTSLPEQTSSPKSEDSSQISSKEKDQDTEDNDETPDKPSAEEENLFLRKQVGELHKKLLFLSQEKIEDEEIRRIIVEKEIRVSELEKNWKKKERNVPNFLLELREAA